MNDDQDSDPKSQVSGSKSQGSDSQASPSNVNQDDKEASRVADAVLTLLALVTSIIVVAGVLTTPLFITFIAPGFTGATRDLTIQLVRIFFPGAGLLVLSAWCLGVLNSHRKFFLS